MPPKKKIVKKGAKKAIVKGKGAPPRKKSKVAKKRKAPSSIAKAVSKTSEVFPLEKGPQPQELDPTQITRLYKLPAGKLKTEDDVIKSLGYKLENKLGEGGFGKIFKASSAKQKCKVACKMCALGDDWKDDRVEDMKNELFIMEKISNLYIVKLYTHFLTQTKENGNRLYIFMELADKGDFSKVCQSEGPMSEKTAAGFFAQIVCGINHMHSMGIAHRDIKMQNVLVKAAKSVSGNLLLLLADFGLSRILRHDEEGELALNKTVCGTPIFMAPEILARKPYNAFGVDIWALGITLYIMVTHEMPFDFRDMEKVVQDQMDKNWEWKDDNMKDPPSSHLKSLMLGLLEPDPGRRLTMAQLISHPWVAYIYKQANDAAIKAKLAS